MVAIRPVDAGALGQALDVYRECEDFLALGPEPKASAEMVLNDMLLSSKEGGVFCGAFDDEGRMLAVVNYQHSGYGGSPDAAFISLLIVRQSQRGKGIGRAILQQVEDIILQGAAIRHILTAVQENNPAALRFWNRMGYSTLSGPHAQPDGTTVFYMEKRVRDR